jgi:hypothetical protein
MDGHVKVSKGDLIHTVDVCQLTDAGKTPLFHRVAIVPLTNPPRLRAAGGGRFHPERCHWFASEPRRNRAMRIEAGNLNP